MKSKRIEALKRVVSALLAISTVSLFTSLAIDQASAVASTHPISGASCKPLGASSIFQSKRYTCVRSGNKLVWNKGVAVKKATTSTTTTSTTTTSTTTTTTTKSGYAVASGCSSSYVFPVLTNVSGAGSQYAKPSVDASCSNSTLTVTSNGMISYTFTPITPNPLDVQSWQWKVPTDPKVATSTTTLVNVMGAIGFTVTGLPIYGPEEGAQPTNEAYGDPVANKILDSCGGHTGPAGEYHYHEIIATSACDLSSTIIGYAFDGFPIYSNPGGTYTSGYQETGNPTTNSWSAYTYKGGGTDTLDRCNGTTVNGQYRYYVTSTFPYILGCYTGTPETQSGNGGMQKQPSLVFSSGHSLQSGSRYVRIAECG